MKYLHFTTINCLFFLFTMEFHLLCRENHEKCATMVTSMLKWSNVENHLIIKCSFYSFYFIFIIVACIVKRKDVHTVIFHLKVE